jgi:hypothetical protein
VKGTRRYRYYVSRNLIQDKPDQAHRGWRLPAAETEGIVAGAAVQILNDQKAILDAVQGTEIATSRVPEIIQSASAWSHRLASATECSSALTVLVDRVELSSDGFHLIGGGGGGIRTHGDLSATPVFKTGAFNRSATPPMPRTYYGFAHHHPQPSTQMLPFCRDTGASHYSGAARAIWTEA